MAPLGAGASELVACKSQRRRPADYPLEGGWVGTQPGKGENGRLGPVPARGQQFDNKAQVWY